MTGIADRLFTTVKAAPASSATAHDSMTRPSVQPQFWPLTTPNDSAPIAIITKAVAVGDGTRAAARGVAGM